MKQPRLPEVIDVDFSNSEQPKGAFGRLRERWLDAIDTQVRGEKVFYCATTAAAIALVALMGNVGGSGDFVSDHVVTPAAGFVLDHGGRPVVERVQNELISFFDQPAYDPCETSPVWRQLTDEQSCIVHENGARILGSLENVG